MLQIVYYGVCIACGVILVLFVIVFLWLSFGSIYEWLHDKYKWRGYKKALKACEKMFTADKGWTVDNSNYQRYEHENGLSIDIMPYMIKDSCDRHQFKRGGDYRACTLYNRQIEEEDYYNAHRLYIKKIHYRPLRQKTNQWVYQMRDIANNPEKYNKQLLLRRYTVETNRLLDILE